MSKAYIKKVFQLGGFDIRPYDKAFRRYAALFAKYQLHTMIPKDFFFLNLELCNAFKDADGDYVECGVWRGGMSAAIAEILGMEKQIHLFDSFEGLPPAKDIDGKDAIAWQQNTNAPEYYDNCRAEERFAEEAMKMANHSNYIIHKGWFEETLPGYKDRSISILRLDGDWYDSIKTCLHYLFPLVVPGGIIIIDDYYTWDGCTKAVHDYLSESQLKSRIYQWNNQIAYIIKSN